MQPEWIQFAQNVILQGAGALKQLSDLLGSASIARDFEDVIELILKLKGRVILTGMGKPSYIARKVAATMASTGTPAQFVHPAEAAHGDLGMITTQDIVVAFSNSGATSELAPIINYTTRYKIPLVAITSEAQSTLAKAATHLLLIPTVDEACPIGLAPTTSTTMMLALADALALTILRAKGFDQEQFKQLHPGGNLAQMLLQVREVMYTDTAVPLVSSGTLMREALVIMTQKSLGCVGVTDQQGHLMGIITDGDLRRHIDSDLLNAKVEEIMTPSPWTIGSDALASEALRLMNERKITSMFVVEDTAKSLSKPSGIIHIHACLRAGVN